MCFISFIIVLNVSIILSMLIVFSNITFVIQVQSFKVYQLADFNNLDYDEYLKRGMISIHEKKLNVNQYFEAIYNLKFVESKLSNEMDFFKYFENIENYCDSYMYPRYAAQQYAVTTFHKSIKEFVKCATQQYTVVPEIRKKSSTFLKFWESNNYSDNTSIIYLKNSPEDIFSRIKNALLQVKADNGCFSASLSIKQRQLNAIDRALERLAGEEPKPPSKQYYIRQFYGCFQKFKNDVFDINFENAKYPTHTTDINIDADKILTEKEKNNILQRSDIAFLKDNKIHEIGYTEMGIEESNILLENYTGYHGTLEYNNNAYKHCRKALINENKKKCEWKYKLTKLSFQYIFPSQSDSLDLYKQKILNIFKNLKNLDKRLRNDVTKKNIYTILEDAFNQMDETYFRMMKNCRALSEESIYDVYLMRLIKNGCRPLAKKEWNEEMNNAKLTNIVAKEELRLRP